MNVLLLAAVMQRTRFATTLQAVLHARVNLVTLEMVQFAQVSLNFLNSIILFWSSMVE